ncbi:MAG: hypothetical protein EOM25_11030 [Deltaproteobacteria bacterium]|nr:hypothetical protein [Deltaproteobacteria bacterium]
MTENVLDLEAELRQLKLDEHCIGFAGFKARLEGHASPREGLIKISSDTRVDSHGYLTLSFLMDIEGDRALGRDFAKIVGSLKDALLTRHLGPTFFNVVISELGDERSEDWILMDVDLFFRNLTGREKGLVENQIIPALGKLLGLKIEPPQWFDEDDNAPSTSMFTKFSRSLGAFFSRKD